MQIHGRAKLGPAGRLALCEAIESGMTFRQVARAMSVSPATAHRWWVDTPTLRSLSDTHWRGRLIVPVVLVALPVSWTLAHRSGSARLEGTPAGGRG